MSKAIKLYTDLKRFNELIDSSDYPINVIARKAGMSRQSLDNKKKGIREITIGEMMAFCEIFNLNKKDREEIFLTEQVRNSHA